MTQVAGSLDCYAQLVPRGPGTGSRRFDSGILRAEVTLLSGIAAGCGGVNVSTLGFATDCLAPDGRPFDLIDLRRCQLEEHRARIPSLLEASFPSPPECGNGVLEAVETCDDGNTNDNDPCTNDCRVATCGDGSVCADATCTTGPGGGLEECDDGTGNGDGVPDSCRTDCALPMCGDGVVDTDEECDPPRNGCDASCRVEGVCGDGQVGVDEQCDDGNYTNGDGCDDDVSSGGNCTRTSCGNGVATGNEQCDDGGESSGCDADCTPVECGDAVVNRSAGEQCDDGNNSDADSCRTGCVQAICGDGVQCSERGCATGPDAEPEQCDDGNASSEDPCTTACSVATCGDGFVCRDARCTSGPTGAEEECDGGSKNSDVRADACRSNCASPFCGDGVVDAGEECDDGAAPDTTGTGCRTDCSLPVVCTVTFGIRNAVTVGALQYEVDYGSAPGGFVGTGDAVSCRSLVPGGLATFRDEDELRLLRETIIALNGFAAPADIATCSFLADASIPVAEDFLLNVLNGSDPNFIPVNVALSVTTIDCARASSVVDRVATGCPPRPREDCLEPGRDKLEIRSSSRSGHSSARWKWRGKSEFSRDALGDPLARTSYRFCAYARSTRTSYPMVSLELPPSLAWTAISSGGWSFHSAVPPPGGVRRIRVDATRSRRALVRVRLRGDAALAAMRSDADAVVGSDDLVLVLQLSNDEGACWNSTFRWGADPQHRRFKPLLR